MSQELYHYGVKGMKWGVRKDRAPKGEVVYQAKTKYGAELTVRKLRMIDQSKFTQWLNRKFPKLAEEAKMIHEFNLHGTDGKKVGDAMFFEPGDGSLALEWIGVRKSQRSQGYARAALDGVISYAKDNGISRLDLTATKMGAPLYESLGFKKTGESDWYDGEYSLEIPQRIKHNINVKTLSDYILEAVDLMLEQESGGELRHYGVKGMKWGVRKDRVSSSRRSPRTRKGQLKKARSDMSKMSDNELQGRINRINKEREYTKLTVKPSLRTRGESKAKAALATIGIATSAYSAYNSKAGKAGRKAAKKAFNAGFDKYIVSEGGRSLVGTMLKGAMVSKGTDLVRRG